MQAAFATDPSEDAFEDDAPRAEPSGDALVVRLTGYEGPLDVLLDLAKRQKVDLRQVSVLQLADQYLAFVEEARHRDAQLAADYLVMASWLTYLKSRLLLPTPPAEDEPSAEEIAAQLAFQLQRLDAMRRAAEALTARPQLGRDLFRRGADGRETIEATRWRADLFGLLSAYAEARMRGVDEGASARPPAPPVLSVEAARARLRAVMPTVSGWQPLSAVMMEEGAEEGGVPLASRVASTLSAALELTRDGGARLRQDAAFGPVLIGPPGAGAPDE